jgi:penicillin-binding protein 1C
MGEIFYNIIYLTVYSLILVGELVRKLIIWTAETIGYILFELFRFLIVFFYKPLKSSLSTFICVCKSLVRETGQIIIDKILIKTPKISLPQFQSIKWFVFGMSFATLFIFLPFIFVSWLKQLPNPQTLSYMKFPATTKFFDRNGRLLYELYAEIDRQPIALSKIPQSVINATIAIEDQEFYRHLGFSPRGIVRASRETFLKHDLQGGSTITQQLIKNTLLTPEPTFRRKVKELVLAFWAERIYTKDEILEMYLNNVAYGGTAWGIKSASQKYFRKPVDKLTLAEAAFLAGLPAAPTTYSPYGARPELSRQRQKLVLSKMRELGIISKEEMEEALNEDLSFNSQLHNIKAPHFVMFVKQQLEEKYGPRVVEQGGLQIKTTLDLEVQETIQEIVKEELRKIARLNVKNAAVLVTKPSTGEIVAMIGSGDYFDEENDGNVNITTTLQQPGSSIKVVNYAAALSKGFTAATIINDSPVVFNQPGGRPYKPVNYDGRFHGPTPLRWALASSYNVPAVKVLNKIGVASMVEQGRLMGIDSWEDDSRFGLSLTLGGGEVTMLDMAEVYGTLANGGSRINLKPTLDIVDFQGEEFEEFSKIDKVKAVPEEVAFIISDILADNKARTPAFGPNSLLNIPDKYVPVKTGTSNQKRDNWTIGYTKDYVVVVWVGNNDNSPMHPTLASGITGATPIWRRTMDYLLQGREVTPPPMPSNLVKIPCYGRYEYFIKQTVPANGCGVWPKPTISPQITPTQ